MKARLITVLMLTTVSSFAQFDPEGAQVISYFPQLADGGPRSLQWTTSLTFVNPNSSFTTSGTVFLYGNDGHPLMLDFGNGAVSGFNFTIAPQGTLTFRSTGSSPTTVTGWAVVVSALPIQGVVQYGYSINGSPQQGVAAQATEASGLFRSPVTKTAGIAIANVYTDAISVNVVVLDSNGNNIGSSSVTLNAMGHTAFTLAQLFPNLSPDFRGTILIGNNAPGPSDTDCVAWTLSSDLGILASYPPSGLGWPVSQYERIWKVWQKVLNTANLAVSLTPPPQLVIDYTTTAINSYAAPAQNQVHIFMNLAELISDSESELSFVVGHELGHIIQGKVGSVWVPSNIEYDADQWGMVLSLAAGYDPYGAAGALAKLSMASGNAGLLSQAFDNLNQIAGLDLHGSFDNRLALVFQNMQQICATQQYQSFCTSYKNLVHPHLPTAAPLAKPATPQEKSANN